MRPVERSQFRRTFFVGKVIIYTTIFFLIGVVALLFIARTEEVVIARGMVKPRFDYEVHATEGGVLVDVKFLGGEAVKTGEPMAQLDDQKLRDELTTKKGQMTEADGQRNVLELKVARLKKDPAQSDQYRFARNELEVAQKEVEAEEKEVARVTTLVRSGVASESEYEKEKVKLDQARGRLKTAEEKVRILNLDLSKDMLAEASAELTLQEKRLASLKEECKTIEDNVERCKIRAPISGQVVFSAKKPGEAAVPGELLFIIAQGSNAEIHVYVDESQIHKVELGQRVHVFPTAFDWHKYGEAKGTVTEIAEYAKEVGGSNQFFVRIVVEETPLPLKFGGSATVQIIVSKRGLLDMLMTR